MINSKLASSVTLDVNLDAESTLGYKLAAVETITQKLTMRTQTQLIRFADAHNRDLWTVKPTFV